VGIGALGSALFATIFPLAAIGGSYALARIIYRGIVRGRYEALAHLMDEMVGVAEEAIREETLRLDSPG